MGLSSLGERLLSLPSTLPRMQAPFHAPPQKAKLQRRLPAGTRVRAWALLVADMLAATVCRLEAGAPSRYDARLGDEREKVAGTLHHSHGL